MKITKLLLLVSMAFPLTASLVACGAADVAADDDVVNEEADLKAGKAVRGK
jgi:hypothetical protein